MISLNIYKLLHVLGILLVFSSFGALVLHALNGGTKATNSGRRLVTISYGVGLFLILLGGFGMLARLGIVQGGLPGWIWLKLVIWVVIGGLMALPYRVPGASRSLWLLGPALGLLAAWAGLYKPF
ncbi:MAG: hypothetical protein M8860_12540 [marine benthic group bacterium]|jgi:hypothetical protein|nr:hypothetical protein [Gemmatimonadota bacterium]MCL7963663.1 hypothetical protein [Candidatus Carthagonibacter metallireducens]MCL7937306.1 hypothetical protein [Gemmatimonadota bacterium]MCL7956799.1 hypothetical protein [Gemmatimonadota bacterium]MCL7964237.1 hypothetical protein [Gemmatimonadota bacterium]